MMNVNLEGAEAGSSGDFTTSNDFRRIMLIRDPLSGGSAATGTTLRGVKVARFASSPTPGTFQVDEKISQASTGAIGKVVEWDASCNWNSLLCVNNIATISVNLTCCITRS